MQALSPKRQQKKKPQNIHTDIVIQVDDYDVSLDAAINHVVYAPQYAWNLDERDPVQEFTTRIVIRGVSTFPEERTGDHYVLTIYGDDAPSRDIHLMLKDIQKCDDKYGAPQYREYRGNRIPVYEPPSGFGLVEKVRGKQQWTAWLHAPTRFAHDLVVLLGHKRPLFLSLGERKKERARWVHSLSLQTSDPNGE